MCHATLRRLSDPRGAKATNIAEPKRGANRRAILIVAETPRHATYRSFAPRFPFSFSHGSLRTVVITNVHNIYHPPSLPIDIIDHPTGKGTGGRAPDVHSRSEQDVFQGSFTGVKG